MSTEFIIKIGTYVDNAMKEWLFMTISIWYIPNNIVFNKSK